MSLSPISPTELLAKAQVFADLDASLLNRLAAALDVQQLADGAVLIRQGDVADALYFITSGEVEVTCATEEGRSVVVDRLKPGAVIGEMALLAGNRRTATVTARGPVSVACFTREAFDNLTASTPGLREQVIAAITPRLERVELAAIFERWFGALADVEQVIQELQDTAEFVAIPGDGVLYRPGDPADGMYLVASGRLQVMPDGGEEAHAYQASRGESVGELGVLGGATRTETVSALRDSHVLRLPATLVESYPAVMARIARTAVERLDSRRHVGVHGNGLRTVALMAAHADAPVREVAGLLERQLSDSGSTLLIDEAYVTSVFGGALPASGSVLDVALTHWLNNLEAEHSYLVLIGDSNPDDCSDSARAWIDRCRRQADAVLVVADATAAPDAITSTAPATAQLVLLHPAGSAAPSGTMPWLEGTRATVWHHVRAGDGYGMPRLVRRLTGRALGLVFSGGGARGYAHIGLLKAVEDLGIEVDMVAGTSMGALIAGGYAFSGSSAEVERAAVMFGDKKRLLDRTLPIVALTKSSGVTNTYTSVFGGGRIEDLWMPFVCVSANLFEAVPVEHTTGLIWEAIRASSAIPGIFTPFVQDGALLVDGAIMNAFPVDLMRDMVGSGTVVASSVMSKSARREPFTFGPSVSGWRALAQYLRPRKHRTRYPTIIKTLMEATSVGSKHQSITARKLADIVVEHPVQAYSKLDFQNHAELIEIGYRHALAELEAWKAAQQPDRVMR
ncbi:MAG TPA: cyclic nucleotide-binding domain-containing protein [Trueperaceae bacterium]|nr:cyclic nucleotide-binding domain-containing protein [Trueperaceae bacterium]